MKKEFAIPPVVFPSGGRNPQSHRVPTAPFQRSPSSNPSIPFMSFDIDPTSSFSAPPYGGGAPTSTSFFSDEPSLLEELEINPTLIYQKTLSLLNPFRINSSIHNSADLSGPFLYYLSFSLLQIFAGKVQFGVVLGWIVMSSFILYSFFNLLEGKFGNLDLYRCFSIVGYSLLPILIFSAVSLFVPPGGAVRWALAAIFIFWSTRVCTQILVTGASSGNQLLWLIAYPCLLIFALFSMLVLF